MQETSREAYASINPQTLLGEIVYRLRESATGLTCDALEIILERSHQSVSSCIRLGVKRRWIEDSGERQPTRSGRRAIIWRVLSGKLE
jgi:hypothetical protein